MMGFELPAELVQQQAQAERTAGQLLTKICHEESSVERARLLSLAFWHAGRATAYEDEARQQAEKKFADTHRGSKR